MENSKRENSINKVKSNSKAIALIYSTFDYKPVIIEDACFLGSGSGTEPKHGISAQSPLHQWGFVYSYLHRIRGKTMQRNSNKIFLKRILAFLCPFLMMTAVFAGTPSSIFKPVINRPKISITNPVQQSRVVAVSGAALYLEVTNDARSPMNANAITVSNKTACPNLSVYSSNCSSVAPGSRCTLELTSNTPYAPCMITVSGSNTANSPTTLIAFFHLGGLVFVESGGSGKVVIDVTQGFSSRWTNSFSDIPGAESRDNGSANTDAVVIDAACTGSPANCAAQRCRDISADWYLPAEKELNTIRSALCSNGLYPCNFGGFPDAFYWSSSHINHYQASMTRFPDSYLKINPPEWKTSARSVRCIRNFKP